MFYPPHWSHLIGHHRIAKIADISRVDRIFDQEAAGKIAKTIEIMFGAQGPMLSAVPHLVQRCRPLVDLALPHQGIPPESA